MKSRRQDVLNAVNELRWCTVREIAEHIGCSERTVQRHVIVLFRELKISVLRGGPPWVWVYRQITEAELKQLLSRGTEEEKR